MVVQVDALSVTWTTSSGPTYMGQVIMCLKSRVLEADDLMLKLNLQFEKYLPQTYVEVE